MVPEIPTDQEIPRMGRGQLIALIKKLRPLVPHVHLVDIKNNEIACLSCRKTVERK